MYTHTRTQGRRYLAVLSPRGMVSALCDETSARRLSGNLQAVCVVTRQAQPQAFETTERGRS